MNRQLFLIRCAAAAIILFIGTSLPAANRPPSRIVSLAPSVTKSLYLLGSEKNVIAITRYCPAGTMPKENVGTVLEPNIEKIAALTPDLVIATKEGNNPHTVALIRKLGIPVYVMPPHNEFADICAAFEALGTLIGKEAKAREIVAAARKRVAAVENRVKGKARPTVFWEVGAQPLITVSNGSFVNDFITRANGVNLFAGMSRRYPQVSREEVIVRNPDIIILVTMGDVTRSEEASWRKFAQLSAVKNNRIYTLRDSLFTDPTPLAIAEGVEKVARLLYPGLDLNHH